MEALDGARISSARLAFGGARGEFHDLETQFLGIVEELLGNSQGRVRNMARLEGLRAQLLMSFATRYRAAVNELADAVIDWLATHASAPEATSRDGAGAGTPLDS